MIVSDSISRLRTYYQRHGLKALLERALLFARRSISANRMVVFYWDLAKPNSRPATLLPAHLTVERKDRLQEIDPQDWQTIVNFWNPELSSRRLGERLGLGASIWMIRCEGQLAGYGWSMTGRTIVPHYCPFGSDDVHFFDFLVFPEFRGRQINPWLVSHMIDEFRAEGRTRAYIEVAEWNEPQLSSLRKTNFQFFGMARKTLLLGRTFVEWTPVPGRQKAKSACATVKKAEAADSARLASHS